MYSHGIPAWRVVAYTYDAAVHCTEHATAAFGADANGHVPEAARDSEGNPVGATFVSDLDGGTTVECCDDDPREVICLACGTVDADRPANARCWNCAEPWRVADEDGGRA